MHLCSFSICITKLTKCSPPIATPPLYCLLLTRSSSAAVWPTGLCTYISIFTFFCCHSNDTWSSLTPPLPLPMPVPPAPTRCRVRLNSISVSQVLKLLCYFGSKCSRHSRSGVRRVYVMQATCIRLVQLLPPSGPKLLLLLSFIVFTLLPSDILFI